MINAAFNNQWKTETNLEEALVVNCGIYIVSFSSHLSLGL